jgi:DNA-binding response OmpR family regulator
MHCGGDVLNGHRNLPHVPLLMFQRTEPTTILIVEDDAVLGEVLARVLTQERQTALYVSNTSHALRLVMNRWPRLVLLDTSLRDGTAWKLAEAIRAAWADLPVIFLTAAPLHRSTIPEWVDRLITKSVNLDELRRTVEAALASGEMHQALRPVESSLRLDFTALQQEACEIRN